MSRLALGAREKRVISMARPAHHAAIRPIRDRADPVSAIAPTATSARSGRLARHRQAALASAAMLSATAICLSIASGTSARAANVEWSGTGSWFADTNWKLLPDGTPVIPTSKDLVFVYKPGPAIDKPGAVARELLVTGGGDGSFVVTAGGTLTTDRARLGVNFNNFGTATITGAGATWNAGWLTLGDNDGAGIVMVSNGGKLTARDVMISRSNSPAGSSVTVTGKGSEWISENVYLGNTTS